MAEVSDLERLRKACTSLLRAIDSLEGRPLGTDRALRKAATHADLSLKFLRSVAVDEEADLAGFLEEKLGDSITATLGRLEEMHAPGSDGEVKVDVVLGSDVRGLSGDSETVPILEFVSWLASQRNIGTLHVQTENETVSLFFDKGAVIFSETLNGPDRSTLGGILVERDILTVDELKCLGESATSSCLNLADALLLKRFVSLQDLQETVQLKIRRLFRAFSQSPSAKFRFQSEPLQVKRYFVRMELNSLILDCARESDEEKMRAERRV